MQSKAELRSQIIAGFNDRIAAVEAVAVEPNTFVLGWKDGARFVKVGTDGKPQIVGFERATHFPSYKGADSWVRKGLTDGAYFAPQVYAAEAGKQHALRSLGQALHQVSNIKVNA